MNFRKNIKWIIFFVIIIFNKSIIAQKIDKSNFIISLQPTYFQIKENNLCGLVHTNLGYKFDIYYEKYTNKFLKRISFSGSFVRPKSKYESSPLSVVAGAKLQYDLMFQINQKDNNSLYFGGLVKADYKLGYFPNIDESHLYWANFFGIGLNSQLKKNIDDHKSIYGSVVIPFLGFVSRPDIYRYYKVEEVSFNNFVSKNHSQLKFSTLNNYFETNANVGINYKISEKFSVGFIYNFNFSRIKTSYSLSFKVLQQSLGLKLIF